MSSNRSIVALDRQLGSPGFFADPYPIYAKLRESAPIYWSETWQAWVCTNYDDTLAQLKDSEHFSNRNRYLTMFESLPADIHGKIESLKRVYSGGVLQADPPDHTRLRDLIRSVFSPRAIERARPLIVAAVDYLIDRVPKHGEMDIATDFAARLPATVLSQLIGIPASDEEAFLESGEDLMGLQAHGGWTTPEAALRANRGADRLERYLRQLATERRVAPGDDLISELASAHLANDRLTEDELVQTGFTLLTAGHHTTRNLITNSLITLFRHPRELGILRSDPSLWPSAVEECLRFESPVQRAWRRVAIDTTYGAHRLRTGQLMFMMIGAANRDPAHFSDPDSFDVRRHPNRHLAFGHGIHFCIGAPLARLEAHVALPRLLERLPTLKIDLQPNWHPNIHMRMPQSLLASW